MSDTGLREGIFPYQALLAALLAESEALHRHLCPRQVLGARLGLYGVGLLGLAEGGERYWNKGKRLLTFVEMDGCGADGVSVATNCWVGRRTLKVVDYGKMAITVVDTKAEVAWRVWPRGDVRERAEVWAEGAQSRWHAYREGYRVMPDSELLQAERVVLGQSVAAIVSRAGVRVVCEGCGEEVMNEREVVVEGRVLCQGCGGGGYYREFSLV
ncbi:MAG TPA: FmdE family protein [Anaerolineae bacterium]|nr:FmdE family protein [Anaerolineae bacterium]